MLEQKHSEQLRSAFSQKQSELIETICSCCRLFQYYSQTMKHRPYAFEFVINKQMNKDTTTMELSFFRVAVSKILLICSFRKSELIHGNFLQYITEIFLNTIPVFLVLLHAIIADFSRFLLSVTCIRKKRANQNNKLVM